MFPSDFSFHTAGGQSKLSLLAPLFHRQPFNRCRLLPLKLFFFNSIAPVCNDASSKGVPCFPPIMSDCSVFNNSTLLYLRPMDVFHQLWRLPSTPEDPPYGTLRCLAFLLRELGLQELSDIQGYAGSGRRKECHVCCIKSTDLLCGSTPISFYCWSLGLVHC